jgi:hypothetical protein
MKLKRRERKNLMCELISVTVTVGHFDDPTRVAQKSTPGFALTPHFAATLPVIPDTVDAGFWGDEWHLTHIPTGYKLYEGESVAQLREIAENLEAVGDIWDGADPNLLRGKPGAIRRVQAIVWGKR